MRRVPWLALAALGAGAGVAGSRLLLPVADRLPACAFKAFTGIPCATCGLTRCVLALGQGEVAAAFAQHPVATLGLLLFPVAGVWDLRRAWRGDPYPALPASPRLRWAAWALLLGTWGLQMLLHH